MSFYELIECFCNINISQEIQDPRMLLLNIASTQIMKERKFYGDKDNTRDDLFQNLLQIADKEPEFVLQVAFYTRNVLLARATSNFILAFATCYDACKPFCRKYFNQIVKLPSDLIEVAEYAQLMRYYLKLEWIGYIDSYYRIIPYNINCRKELNFSKMLQKCGASKFEEFSLHSLAKYCSDRRRKRIIYRFGELVDDTLFMKRYKKRSLKMKEKEKVRQLLKKKQRKQQDKRAAKQIQKKIQKQQKHTKQQRIFRHLERKFLTMKDLIAKFHISKPKYHVMCILRCKYPQNKDVFSQLFQQDDLQFKKELCGKRMKLPNIVTWDRELSQEKNEKVWDKLLKENRLPYLAMLRNLRNILSGYLSPKAFSILQQYISNSDIVRQNKVQLLQYYKAQETLLQMNNDRAKHIYQQINQAIGVTLKNISTISGKTHIFVDCTGSLNFSQGNQTMQTSAFVISQIIRMKCEYAEYYVFGGEKNNEPYLRVNFYDEDLYESTQRCDMARRQIGNYYAMIGQTFLDLLLRPKIFCDNIIVISDMIVQKCFRVNEISFDMIINEYVKNVNPKVAIYFMDVSGSGYQLKTTNSNCHILSGMSERILEYIALQHSNQIEQVLQFAKKIDYKEHNIQLQQL